MALFLKLRTKKKTLKWWKGRQYDGKNQPLSLSLVINQQKIFSQKIKCSTNHYEKPRKANRKMGKRLDQIICKR